MRADRLVATLLVLQARGRVTAADLAVELETSVATARRDLEALSAAGIPVYPQAGRGGGWQLIGGARTDLSGLSYDEARALFLLVGPAAAVDPEAKSALRKLVRALPVPFRADAEAAAGAVVIDASRWGEAAASTPPLVVELQRAIVSRRFVRMRYRAWDREPSERLVAPLGVVEKGATWYLVALAGDDERTYRVDRMLELTITDDTFERPADFDLGVAWERISADVDTRAVDARVSDIATIVQLRRHLGEPDYDGPMIPASLAAELARLGARLVERYAAL